MTGYVLTTFVVAVGINIVLFIPAYYFKTDKLTDISYALTFIILATYSLLVGGYSFFSVILWLMICLWAARLGAYLLIRIRKMNRDKRFDGMREKFFSFLKFWLLQGVTVWVVLLPSLLFLINPSSNISCCMIIGMTLWLIGVLIESIADAQKYKFTQNPKNKGAWISSGLWKYSRHPNYFGEILLWFGVFIYTLSGLTLTQSLIGLISPLFIATLLMFVSGIPLLEKSADKRWGKNSEYQTYKKKTSILIPLPPK